MASASQLHMMCAGVSSSMLQSLHMGEGLFVGSRRWLCLFRKQCPVSHLDSLPKSSLFSLRRWLLLAVSTLGKNIWVCL